MRDLERNLFDRVRWMWEICRLRSFWKDSSGAEEDIVEVFMEDRVLEIV